MNENRNKFKVGDWVISTSWIYPDPKKITKIELASAPDEEDFVFFREDWCVEMKYIQKWIPKEGDWCWNVYYGLVNIIKFKSTSDIEIKCVYGIKNLNNNPSATLEELEPFIGKLPSKAKRITNARI